MTARPITFHLRMLVAAMLAPLLAFSGFLVWQFAQHEREFYENSIIRSAESAAIDIDREIQSTLITLKTLAGAHALEVDDLASFHRRARSTFPPGITVLLLDTGLQQRVNTLVEYGAPLPKSANPEGHQKVIDTGAPQVSDAFIGLVSKRLVVDVSYPVRIGGTVKYILVAAFDTVLLSKLLESQSLPEGWISGLTDRTGRVIGRSAQPETYIGRILPAELLSRRDETRPFITHNLDGEPVLRAVAKSVTTGWVAAVTVPLSIVDKASRSTVWIVLLAGALLTALSMSLATVIGTRMTAPLLQAAEFARDPDAQNSPPPSSTLSEADAVAAALADSRLKLRLTLESAGIGIYEWDIHENELRWDETIRAQFALPSNQSANLDVFKAAIHPNDLHAVRDAYAKAMDPVNGGKYQAEYRVIGLSDGVQRWLAATGHVLFKAGKPVRILGTSRDITLRKHTEQGLARNEVRLKTALEAGGMGTWQHDIGNGTLAIDETYARLLGLPPGQHAVSAAELLANIVHPDDRGLIEQTREKLKSGERQQIEYRIIRPSDHEIRWLRSAASRLPATDASVIAIVGIDFDITDRKSFEQRQFLMARELAHRVKNTFAVLQSIMNATFRTTPDPKKFVEVFSGRLASMASAHDTLISSMKGAELGTLIRSQLSAYIDAGRLTANGPSVSVPEDAAIPLGLAIHELATNAAKYGALSKVEGRVVLEWTVTSDDDTGFSILTMKWLEIGGPTVKRSGYKGFGSTLIHAAVPRGSISTRFEESGVICDIVLRFKPVPTALNSPDHEPLV